MPREARLLIGSLRKRSSSAAPGTPHVETGEGRGEEEKGKEKGKGKGTQKKGDVEP